MSAPVRGWVAHVAGEIRDGGQACARCGEPLFDARRGPPAEAAWPPGLVVYTCERRLQSGFVEASVPCAAKAQAG